MARYIYHFLIFSLTLLTVVWKQGASNVIILLALSWLLENNWKENGRRLNTSIVYKPFVALFLLYVISFFIYQGKAEGFELQKRLALFALPTVILGSKFFNKKTGVIGIIGFIIGVFIINVKASILSIFHYLEIGSLDFTNGELVYQLIHFQRPYIGAFSTLSLGFCLLLFNETKNKTYRFLLIAAICFDILIPNLIAAKLAMITQGLIIISFLFYRLYTFNKWISFGSALCIPLIGIALFNFNPNVKTRFKQLINYEERNFLWPSTMAAMGNEKFHFFYGTGNERLSQEILNEEYKKETQIGLGTKWRFDCIALLEQYKIKNQFTIPPTYDANSSKGRWFWLYATKANRNTHNQFLGLLLTYGLIGLSTLLLLIFSVLYKLWQTKNPYLFVTILVLGLFLTVENILATQHGVFVFSTFLPLFYREDH